MHPIELYKDNVYRVCHSQEELQKLIKDGWSMDRSDDVQYVPITAISGPKAPQSAGAGANLRNALREKGEALAAAAANERQTKLAMATK